MLTFENLLECGDSEEKISDFIRAKIDEQNKNPRFLEGVTAGEFFRDGDPTIQNYEHIVYDLYGAERKDVFRANNKVTVGLYKLFIMQEVSYLLGNGVSFDNEAVKKKLGDDFDYDLQELATWAANDSESYAYLREDGIETLNVACDDEEPHFIPIYSVKDRKQPKAGIKWWRAGKYEPLNAVLFKPEGYSEWAEVNNVLTMTTPTKKYTRNFIQNSMGETWEEGEEEAPVLPIIPLFYINHKSAIHNKQSALTAYNLILSGLCNNMTEVNLLYWVLRNADGMDDQDYEDFLSNLYKSHILPLTNGVEADPHEINPDYEGHEAALTRLRAELFQSFMAVDVQSIQGGNKTTVEINAAYENLNLKCDEIEKNVGRFLRKLLDFYGFDKSVTFSFTRPENKNITEYMVMLNAAVNLIGEETAREEAFKVLGLMDKYENAVKQIEADEMNRMISRSGDDTNDSDRQVPGGNDR